MNVKFDQQVRCLGGGGDEYQGSLRFDHRIQEVLGKDQPSDIAARKQRVGKVVIDADEREHRNCSQGRTRCFEVGGEKEGPVSDES